MGNWRSKDKSNSTDNVGSSSSVAARQNTTSKHRSEKEQIVDELNHLREKDHIRNTGEKPRTDRDVAHINFLLREVFPFEMTHIVFSFALQSPPIPFFGYFDIPEWATVKEMGYFPCPTFRGSKPGLSFKLGDHGIGYYKDVKTKMDQEAVVEMLVDDRETSKVFWKCT
mgnify:CR=1 FL=1